MGNSNTNSNNNPNSNSNTNTNTNSNTNSNNNKDNTISPQIKKCNDPQKEIIEKGKNAVYNKSKMEDFSQMKILMQKLGKCFTDDGGKMVDYYEKELKNPELKLYCVSSWTFCY